MPGPAARAGSGAGSGAGGTGAGAGAGVGGGAGAAAGGAADGAPSGGSDGSGSGCPGLPPVSFGFPPPRRRRAAQHLCRTSPAGRYGPSSSTFGDLGRRIFGLLGRRRRRSHHAGVRNLQPQVGIQRRRLRRAEQRGQQRQAEDRRGDAGERPRRLPPAQLMPAMPPQSRRQDPRPRPESPL